MREQHEIILSTHKKTILLKGVRTVPGNFGSFDTIRENLQKIQPDLIINTAAITNVDECEHYPGAAYELNAEFTHRIAKAAFLEKISFIHISTDQLFDGSQSFIKENEIPSPLNVYGKTKALAELYVLQAAPTALILRTNFFAWGHKFRNSLTDWILQSMRSDQEIKMFKDVFFTPILADNLIKTAHILLEAREKGIFHIVGDERISKYDFAIRIAKIFGFSEGLIIPIHLADKKLAARRPFDMSLNNHKTCSATGKCLGDIDMQINELKLQQEKGRAEELRTAVVNNV